MIAVLIVAILAGSLMGSAATDNGATIQRTLDQAQTAIVKRR